MSTPRTMAVSTLCRGLLTGPRVALTTSYQGTHAVHLTHLTQLAGRGQACRRSVSLLTSRAVRLPVSLLVPVLPPGSPRICIGDGALWYDDHRVTVSRWFTPARVARGSLRGLARPRGPARHLVGGWRDRLGEGAGLTPYGDDVTCGVVLALLATDHEDADQLCRDLRETDLEARTTPVSAGLLRCAADGWCIPEVDRLLGGLITGAPAAPAVAALLAVGHSSGHGLLAGLSSVLDLPFGSVAA